jgi:hypothetical protein
MKKNKYLKYLINDEYEEDLPSTEIQVCETIIVEKDKQNINEDKQNINEDKQNINEDKQNINEDKQNINEDKQNDKILDFIKIQREERSLNLQLLQSKINNISILNIINMSDDDDFIEDDFEYINESNSTDSDE